MPKLAVEQEQPPRGSIDALYDSDEFRMYCFKVLPCSKHYSHDWTVCPFAHPGEKARRRDPRVFKYAGVECPHVKEGLKCPRGDLCPFAHNIFECWLHPTRYRTQLCNEPASCKRKVCFFAHKLEELREPSNPIDSLPEGGIGSGTAPLMSLDGLATSGAFSGLVHPQRQSVDVASLQHLNSLGTANSLNLNDLVSNMQGVNVQNQAQQNQQLTQLLINLLAEIDLNGQHQNLIKAQQQQFQRDAVLTNALGAMGTFPRWSVDGRMLSPAQFQSFPPHLQTPHAMVPGVLPNLSTPHDAMFNRSASMEMTIRDAMSEGIACRGRVSVDNAALTRAPVSPPMNLQQQAQALPRRDPIKVNFKSIVEMPARSSEEDSSGMSSGDTSTDSRAPESYPVTYPLDGADIRKSVDCTLPDSFILF